MGQVIDLLMQLGVCRRYRLAKIARLLQAREIPTDFRRDERSASESHADEESVRSYCPRPGVRNDGSNNIARRALVGSMRHSELKGVS